ncbi:acyltransferase family protein [Rhizobium sp. G187]|uniref:acyltransferase family protein n=1 Tax=Rhizobium sp. G187 TaxID=3451352 RepID=UPI003EE47B2D
MLLEEKLGLSGGRPTGFDYMRIILSILVVWIHTARVTTGDDLFIWESAARPFLKSVLPMFFILSGFLVAGSLGRARTLVSFLGNRFIRIYPALAVEVFLSALLLGVLFTSLSPSAYFTDPEFFRYLFNVTGHIHFTLPGVFETNPDGGTANIQLWTVPYELECYAAIAILFLVGVVRYRILSILAVVGCTITYGLIRYAKHGPEWASFPTVMSGNLLICGFLLGVVFYLYRDRILWDRRLFGLSCASVLFSYWYTSMGDFLALPGLAYITIFLGLCSPRKIGILKGADYSYGIFLYGYPIQQALYALGPAGQNWFVNGLLATVLAAGFAAMSWHFVEKPALKLRRVVMALEERWLELSRRLRFRRRLGLPGTAPSATVAVK